jgi:hypothetical protein
MPGPKNVRPPTSRKRKEPTPAAAAAEDRAPEVAMPGPSQKKSKESKEKKTKKISEMKK